MNAVTSPPADEARILAAVERHRHRDGPLIEVLHEVQADFGCIPPGAVPVIARALNLSRAEVHGVVSFYHYFRTQAPGRHVLQICRAESCQSAGGRAIESARPGAARRRLRRDDAGRPGHARGRCTASASAPARPRRCSTTKSTGG